MRQGLSMMAAAALVAAACAAQPADAKNGRNGALLGGAAVGVVGGVLLNQALQGNAQAAPPPERVYVEPAPPPPVYVERQPAYDPVYDRAARLHDGCDAGDRRSCIEFGILIGQNRERQASWKRRNSEMFAWDNY